MSVEKLNARGLERPIPGVPLSHATALPMLIGVSGHRDPLPEHAVEQRRHFRAFLDRLVEECPNTPLVLLNGLASGSDQLCAGWAEEWTTEEGPWRGGRRLIIVGVLPMPLEEFTDDFRSTDELAGLQSALDRCAYLIELPVEGIEAAGRDAMYDQHAAFIASQSSVVVAFWNGEETPKPGGTASVLRRARTGSCKVAQSALGLEVLRSYAYQVQKSSLMPDGTYALESQPGPWVVPWHWIAMPRRSAPFVPGVGSGSPLQPWIDRTSAGDPACKEWQDILAEREVLNLKLAKGNRRGRRPGDALNDVIMMNPLDAFRQRCAGLDRLSGRERTALKWSGLIEVIVLCLAILSFSIVTSFGDNDFGNPDGGLSRGPAALLMVAGLGLLVFWLVIWRRAARQKLEWWMALSRTIVECLRVQEAIAHERHHEQVGNWMLARTAAQTNPLRRLLHAANLELLWLDARAEPVDADGTQADGAMAWIRGQIAYFSKALKEGSPRKRLQRRFRAVKTCSKVLVLVSYVLLLAAIWHDRWPLLGVGQESWIDALSLVVAALLTASLAAEWIEGILPVEEELKSFGHMEGIHRRAEAALFGLPGLPPGDPERRRLINDLGKEAIDECSEWFVTHSERRNEFRIG